MFGLFLCFHALRDHRQAQGFAHRNDGVRQPRVFSLAEEVAYERAVNFDRIERESLQQGKRGLSSSEIVDGDPNSQRLEPRQNLQCVIDVVDQQAFGELDLQQARIHTGGVQDRLHIGQ
jgi:hypothetical protein